MEFRWFCRQLDESYTMLDSDPDVRMFENGDFVPSERISATALQDNQANIPPAEFQNGGCFGSGPSKFEVSSQSQSCDDY